ncbi:MAG: XdhC family protein [Anaerolineales bacterium]
MIAELEQIADWQERGRKVALATVVSTWGSSPRQPGAVMAITDRSEISGSVSGGCVEGAVIDAGLEVIRTGTPRKLHFGVANEEAWEVGLSCGGEIDIYLEPFGPEELTGWLTAFQKDTRFCRLLILEGDSSGKYWFVFPENRKTTAGSIPALPGELFLAARDACGEGRSSLHNFSSPEYQEVFLQVCQPARKLILVGGVHIAIPLVSMAHSIGFEVILIDPRRLFGTQERFPEVEMLLQEWPQDAFPKIKLNSASAVVTLTHDPKIDDPALQAALDSEAFYIGALGSRRTHQKRRKRLEELGWDSTVLDRIHAPVGLNLGGTAPEEIALAVMAEIVQTWHSQG